MALRNVLQHSEFIIDQRESLMGKKKLKIFLIRSMAAKGSWNNLDGGNG